MDRQHLFFSLLLTFFFHFSFGLYGARFRRFTRPWGRCLYIPIIITIILRRSLGIGHSLIPYFIAVAIIGQLVGKGLGKRQLNLLSEKAEQA